MNHCECNPPIIWLEIPHLPIRNLSWCVKKMQNQRQSAQHGQWETPCHWWCEWFSLHPCSPCDFWWVWLRIALCHPSWWPSLRLIHFVTVQTFWLPVSGFNAIWRTITTAFKQQLPLLIRVVSCLIKDRQHWSPEPLTWSGRQHLLDNSAWSCRYFHYH